MSALDRAIIKAFHRPTSRSGAAVVESPADAPRVAASPTVPLSQALAELAAVSAPPIADTRESIAAETIAPETIAPEVVAPETHVAVAKSPEPEAVAPEPPKPVAVAPKAIEPEPAMPPVAEQRTAPVGPGLAALLDNAMQATSVVVHAPSSAEIGDAPGAPTGSVAVTSQQSASLPANTFTISQEPMETSWRPLLQVDRVVWPSIYNRLQTTAPAAIEQMTEGLLSICESGSKLLGLASCAAGEGVTTLLLAAARKLLSQGRKVVLVDANWSHPQLAQSLGLLPQIGWEETLCGGLPLEEVVIESLEDGLAVLPVREPPAGPISRGQIAASLNILAREFDVVLVDLGPLAEVEEEDTSARVVAARMDAVILVQNVRVTTPNRLAEVRARLAASNMRHAGTIQNFVAG